MHKICSFVIFYVMTFFVFSCSTHISKEQMEVNNFINSVAKKQFRKNNLSLIASGMSFPKDKINKISFTFFCNRNFSCLLSYKFLYKNSF